MASDLEVSSIYCGGGNCECRDQRIASRRRRIQARIEAKHDLSGSGVLVISTAVHCSTNLSVLVFQCNGCQCNSNFSAGNLDKVTEEHQTPDTLDIRDNKRRVLGKSLDGNQEITAVKLQSEESEKQRRGHENETRKVRSRTVSIPTMLSRPVWQFSKCIKRPGNSSAGAPRGHTAMCRSKCSSTSSD